MTTHPGRATLMLTPRGPVRCVHLQGVEAHRIGFPPLRGSGHRGSAPPMAASPAAGTIPTGYGARCTSARPGWPATSRSSHTRGRVRTRRRTRRHRRRRGRVPHHRPGQLPRSWVTPRVAATGAITGWYVRPGDLETLATPRVGFRGAALRHGLPDLDGAAIRDGRPRALTQPYRVGSTALQPRTGPGRWLVSSSTLVTVTG